MVMTQVLHKPPGLRTIPADMPPRANRRGIEARARIVREVRERDAAGALPASLEDLADLTKLDASTVSRHVKILTTDGELHWEQVTAAYKVLRPGPAPNK